MNDYDIYDDEYVDRTNTTTNGATDLLHGSDENQQPEIDFDDPMVVALPRIVLMGPRRGGKTSIQVSSIFLKSVFQLKYFSYSWF